MGKDATYYETLPFVDHEQLMREMAVAERLFHIINLANYRYDHSPEQASGEPHSQSRGTMLHNVSEALVGRGYTPNQVSSAINRVIHGNY